LPNNSRASRKVFGQAVVDTVRDQMRADEAVGAGAADEKAGEEQPEAAWRGRSSQDVEGNRDRLAPFAGGAMLSTVAP
jgi:hypothetical protein